MDADRNGRAERLGRKHGSRAGKNEGRRDIADLLSRGSDNAKTGKELCAITGMSLRDLTQTIERERRNGAPICATCNGRRPGYYLAATRAELEGYCRSLLKRAGEIHKTRKACLKILDILPEETRP